MIELKIFKMNDVLWGHWFTEYYLKSEADKVIARYKYKRCLAMAQVIYHVCPMTNRKAKWRDKWQKRWLTLADKYKEGNV